MYFPKLCAYLTHCSEAEQKCRQAIQTNFLLSTFMVQNLVDNKQTHRALEGIQLCKGHERISRENQNVCRFLGSVLMVSNSTFRANLE